MSDFFGKDNLPTLLACGAGLAIAAYGLYYISRYRQNSTRKWREVGVVSQIFVHPVKACRGIELTEAACTALGPKSLHGVPDRYEIYY